MFDCQTHTGGHSAADSPDDERCGQDPASQRSARRRRAHLEAARTRLAEEMLRDSTADHVASTGEQAREIAGDPAREVVVAVDLLGALGWSEMDGQIAMATVLELEGARRALDSALATGMAHLERRGITLREHGLGTARWLSHESRGSAVTAKRSVEMGVILARFRLFAEDIRIGRLSTDHAMALQSVSNPRIAELLVEVEPTLIEMARTTSFATFRRNLRVVANQLDEDGAEPDCSDHDELSISSDSQGGVHLRGRLSGHQATVFEKALRDAYDRQWRAARADYRQAGVTMPSPAVLRARALVEIVRIGLGSEPGKTNMARTEALLVIEQGETRTDDGEPLDATTAAVFACDAWYQPLVIDPATNTPLFAGRASRYATREQRRALIVRDGGCIFPGCEAPPSWCDVHHIIAWEDGGLTDIDNLAMLCRRHHGYAHSKRWTLEAIPIELSEQANPAPRGAVRFVWHTPNGLVEAQHQNDRRRRTAA